MTVDRICRPVHVHVRVYPSLAGITSLPCARLEIELDKLVTICRYAVFGSFKRFERSFEKICASQNHPYLRNRVSVSLGGIRSTIARTTAAFSSFDTEDHKEEQ